MITVRVNDQTHSLDDGCTVADLLRTLGMQKPHLAVALNDNVLPRAEHPTTRLNANDEIIIVQAVGGG